MRNRLKIKSAIGNARALLAVAAEHGSFDAWIWDSSAARRSRASAAAAATCPRGRRCPTRCQTELRRRGFSFVGSTIVYAFMQASGLVNDHTLGCFRRTQVAALGRRQRAATADCA